MQAIVRRAYDLGKKEALKKVVDVLSTDRACAEPLALAAPAADVSMANAREPAGTAESPMQPWYLRTRR